MYALGEIPFGVGVLGGYSFVEGDSFSFPVESTPSLDGSVDHFDSASFPSDSGSAMQSGIMVNTHLFTIGDVATSFDCALDVSGVQDLAGVAGFALPARPVMELGGSGVFLVVGRLTAWPDVPIVLNIYPAASIVAAESIVHDSGAHIMAVDSAFTSPGNMALLGFTVLKSDGLSMSVSRLWTRDQSVEHQAAAVFDINNIFHVAPIVVGYGSRLNLAGLAQVGVQGVPLFQNTGGRIVFSDHEMTSPTIKFGA